MTIQSQCILQFDYLRESVIIHVIECSYSSMHGWQCMEFM